MEPEEKNHAEKTGSVTLVGAGCGPDLITLKGLMALRRADTVVYDDLIDRDLLDEAPAASNRIYVGKRYGEHSKKQPEINEILIREAKKGRRVVRLKGGDSFVFGRGGEEYLALRKAGVPCAVIPGISSAIAVPEEAGIPVTHRKVARSFTVVTGHTADGSGENFEALAGLKGTLIFLMPVHSLSFITDSLIRYGRDPDTPAAVISRGYMPDEKRIDGTLADIAVKAADAPTPAILVVGETAAFSMISKCGGPLEGVRVTVTGTRSFVHRVREQLEESGARAFPFPTVRIVPHEERIPEALSGYGWLVFTSSNGVEIFFDFMKNRKQDIRSLSDLRFAVIGKGTARTLLAHGIRADLVPGEFTAEALGDALATEMGLAGDNSRVLILRAQNGSPLLTDALLKAGISFDDVKIYETVSTAPPEEVPGSGYIVFGSAGGVRAFFSMGYASDAMPVCIGRQTAKELRMHTDGAFLIAKKFEAEGIVQTIAEHFHKNH